MTPSEQSPIKAPAPLLQFPSKAASGEPPMVARSLQRDLLASIAAGELATILHDADRALGRPTADVDFDDLPAAAADKVRDRAAIAIGLGDVIKRRVVDEKAALALLLKVGACVRDGSIPRDSPLAAIDMSAARVLAKFAVSAALDALAGKL